MAWIRRRKADRPVCEVCGSPWRAVSTPGAITYYAPTCPHGDRLRKVPRDWVDRGQVTDAEQPDEP